MGISGVAGWRERNLRSRVGVVVLPLLAIGALIGLGFSVLGLSHAGDDAAAFAKAPACSATTGANSDCIRWVDGTVVAKHVVGGHAPEHRLDVSFSGGTTTLDFPADGSFLGSVAPRDAVRLGMWHGTVALVEDHGRRGPTLADPSYDYRSDKAVSIFLLGLALFCVPVSAVSILREPSELTRRRPGLVFGFTFAPIAGVILMITAGTLSEGMSDLGNFSIAGTLLVLTAGLAGLLTRRARRKAKPRTPLPVPPPLRRR
jgi:hypothetical protein